MVSERRPTAMSLRAVFCVVLAAFLGILGSKAAEGAPFSSYFTVGTGVCLDLCRIMFEDRLYNVVRFTQKKKLPRLFGLGTLIGRN
jgi:hypothetical protein